jgi:membrane protease YdiL (CAAX protease family)
MLWDLRLASDRARGSGEDRSGTSRLVGKSGEAGLMTAIVLLILFVAVLAWFASTDGAEYRRFKTFSDTRDRQRIYAVWLLKSVLAFGGGSLASLALLRQWQALTHFPPAFAPLLRSFRTNLASGGGASAFILGMGAAFFASLIVLSLILRARAKRRSDKPKQIVIGDIQPLLPRNAAERWWAALLSVNAGVSEELFFRLVLPLVLAIVFGNAAVAFVLATLAFGLAHLYQGWAGVVATTVVGAVMSAIYLATGDIWVAVILHAAIDLNGLLVMPYLAERRARVAQ